MEIKKSTPTNTVTRKLVDLDKETGNIYETVNIIARRANQISTELKAELTRKLADFSSPTDTMEETFENREQIDAFLARHADAALERDLQLVPDDTHDGFYYAVLVRR